MARRLRLFTKRFFLVISLTIVGVFLLACLAPYLNPQTWWFLSFLSLGFPFLLTAVLGIFIFWLLAKKKWSLIPLAAILIGYKSIASFIAFNLPQQFNPQKQPNDIRIITWNVANFVEKAVNKNKGNQIRLQMMEQIKKEDADIICFQEFYANKRERDFHDNIEYFLNNTPFSQYKFLSEKGNANIGVAIFSKHPIVNTEVTHYTTANDFRRSILAADIKINNKIIRVHTSHLQSPGLQKKDYKAIDKIKAGEELTSQNSRNILSKLKHSAQTRAAQANIIKETIGKSPYPVIVCGDFNDVPNSYTYKTIRGNMQDAFLKKGTGIGRTFAAISPTLRIDYLFADDNFSINQYKRIVKASSDHYMQVVDVSLK